MERSQHGNVIRYPKVPCRPVEAVAVAGPRGIDALVKLTVRWHRHEGISQPLILFLVDCPEFVSVPLEMESSLLSSRKGHGSITIPKFGCSLQDFRCYRPGEESPASVTCSEGITASALMNPDAITSPFIAGHDRRSASLKTPNSERAMNSTMMSRNHPAMATHL